MWEIIGFEKFMNDAGNITGCSLYCRAAFKDGSSGVGYKVCKEYYKPGLIDYTPSIGDTVVFVKEQFGDRLYVTDIIKMY